MHLNPLVLGALMAVTQVQPPMALAQEQPATTGDTTVPVHVVSVGLNESSKENALRYFPEKINATVGSMVQFQFWAGNHTVTQSNFDKPCVPISSAAGNSSSSMGIWSGFVPAAASMSSGKVAVYTIMVKDTKPMWIFCSQGPHCKKGMSMVINENTEANATRSLKNYKLAAEQTEEGGSQIPGGASQGSTGGSTGSTGGTGGTGGTSSGSQSSSSGSTPPASSARVSAANSNFALPATLLLVLGAAFMLL